jgi:hypothetical protein
LRAAIERRPKTRVESYAASHGVFTGRTAIRVETGAPRRGGVVVETSPSTSAADAELIS